MLRFAVHGWSVGGSVLPQNFQQPIASQLTQPVLTSQQAMQLIPNDQLQVSMQQLQQKKMQTHASSELLSLAGLTAGC